MFVLCELYSKDKRHSQDNQDKVVQMKYREQKEITMGAWMVVLFMLYNKDKRQSQDKAVQSTEREQKKNPAGT